MILTTLSPKPLFDWFAKDKDHRAKLRQAGYSDGRITNWKRRGIPRAEVGNVAQLMGLTYEEYVTAADIAERRVKTWRRAAMIAALTIGSSLLGVDKTSIAATSDHNFANKYNVLHIVRRWFRQCFARFAKFNGTLENRINNAPNWGGTIMRWTRRGTKPA